MRKEDIQELKLMEEVSRHEGLATQRELAQSLSISLGLVNAFIKRIVRKGYFKVTTMPGRRVCYLLTPQGLAEKSRLTVEYLQYSLSYYREIRLRMAKIAGDLKKRGVQEIALVGTGEFAELFSLSTQEAGIEITRVVSGNETNRRFLGRDVGPLNALKHSSFDVVCIMEADGKEQIVKRLAEIGIAEEQIVDGSGM